MRHGLRSLRRSALVALASFSSLAGGLACDGLRSQANPAGPSWKHHPAWAMRLEYSRDLVADSRHEGEPYERGQPEIDARGRRVFVGSSDGGMYALTAPLGEVLWRFQTLSYVQSTPLYVGEEDVLYFGSHDGALYKVRADSGEMLWRLFTRAEIARQPIVSGDLVYFSNANDTLIAADRQSGKIVWSHHRTPALGMEVAGYSGPALKDGLVYMGFSDGTALAFDALTGEERWQPVDLAAEAEDTIGEIPKYLDVDTTPELIETSAGPVAVFGSYVGGVYALDAEMGTLVWANSQASGVSDLQYWQQPAYEHEGIERPARRLLLVSTGTTGLWALDPDTGEEVWRQRLPRGGVSRPVPVAGALMINASQLGTFLLSPIDGSPIDGIHVDDGASGTPAALGNRAFVMTNGGHFLALSIAVPRLDPAAPRYREQGQQEPFPYPSRKRHIAP